jgi:hypothetical protein
VKSVQAGFGAPVGARQIRNRTSPITCDLMKRFESVILLDVDNTLLDDDRIIDGLRSYLRRCLGSGRERHYVSILKRLHARLGYADYLGALQHYRLEHPADPHVLRVSCFLIEYPFEKTQKHLRPADIDSYGPAFCHSAPSRGQTSGRSGRSCLTCGDFLQ